MRRTLGILALLALVAIAGCFGMFGGISEEKLCEEGHYDFSTDANATYTVATNGTYRAVYKVHNRSTFELYRTDGLGNDKPLQISAVEFRAANGTVYDCEDVDVETTRRRTIVSLPADNGTFAYTAESPPKRFSSRQYVEGTHEVILPEDRVVRNPLFSSVSPGGYERETVDDRVHIRWDEIPSTSVAVRYYMPRDVAILGGIVGVVGLAAGIGLAYYYRLVKRLRQRREEYGLDVDVEDDDRDPPPGLR